MPTISDGREAIEQGNLQQARLIFEAILQETPRNEDAWMGLADVLTDNEDKRVCYENVLKINKNNQAAREGLRNLEPQANPFVAALQPAASDLDDEDDEDGSGDETMTSRWSDTQTDQQPAMVGAAADGAPTTTPTVALVALGLVLSVLVFACSGGLAYYVITTLTGR